MRQRFAKWMMGRNGMDALNRLLSVLTLILLIVSMFVHGYAARILWSLAVLGLIVIYFRMLSRNVYRRQQENGAYLRQRYKVTSAWRGAVDRWHQRHDYRFFKWRFSASAWYTAEKTRRYSHEHSGYSPRRARYLAAA